ncbi:MAG: PD-(D/E)XK nuclease family protein [Candidatus Velthaea sp.]
MTAILVDERRLAAGLDAALSACAATGPCELLTPAALLQRLTGVRVIGDAERRAVIRRIAATRDDIVIPRQIREAPGFATRVAAAIDGTGERAPYEPILEQYATLLAFANVLDVPEALRRALAGEREAVPAHVLGVDTVLLAASDRAFAWRRLFAAAGITLEPLSLGEVEPPQLDPAILETVEAALRYAAHETDAGAQAAILARASGVRADDARMLLTLTAERGSLLETIDGGKAALGPTARRDAARFAQGLRAVARSYALPDASAASVLAAVANAFAFGHPPTVAALVAAARNFDRARTLGPLWDADALIAEFEAEFDGARRTQVAPMRAAPAAVPPQDREPVVLRRMHFSPSSLNAYAECARKWYFRYACAAVEDRGSSASFYGTAFHAALEEFHLRYPHIEGEPAAELASFLDGCVNGAFDRYRTWFDAPVEFELQRRRARRTARKYAAWLIERAARAPFTVIGCEVATELELEGHAFVGFIDRLDRDDRNGAVTVIDYKTGSIAKSAAEYRAAVAGFREFQLPFYYWARTAAGDRVTRLALVPLKDALLDVAPIELEIVAHAPPIEDGWRRDDATAGPIAVAELERARTRMIEHARLLAGGTLTAYPATDDPEACRYCAYRDGCRERPLAAEERFGR